MNQILADFEKAQIQGKRPELHPGDIVRVEQKLDEVKTQKGKGGARKSIFEGIIISIRNPKTVKATITLRKVSFGIGVEKVLPLYSPTIDKIQILKRTQVRRAKLYYLRERFGKKAKMKDKSIDKETLKALGWEEPQVAEKKAEEIQEAEAAKAKKAVEEILKAENQAEVSEKSEDAEKKTEPKTEENQPKAGPPGAGQPEVPSASSGQEPSKEPMTKNKQIFQPDETKQD